MTNEQAKKMLKAKLECLKRETSGTDFDCNNSNCDECSLCYEQGNMGEQKEALDMAIKALEQEPCEDTISRQAAMDALHMHLMYRMGTDSNKKRLDDWINGVPSVQPERTCVNCGRTINNGGWYADGRTRCPIEEHYALPKDGFCHLWEKRNVTDDDYPERREE